MTWPLRWTVVFAAVAVIAAALGFTGLAGSATDLLKVLFWAAAIVALVAFIIHTVRRA